MFWLLPAAAGVGSPVTGVALAQLLSLIVLLE
jgi:hypothetical protein